ncbi:MAG: AbrB/MazE/SpoVT family DNA-binding domain-containing protein [Promethearchaeota archaeon]
MKIKGLIIKNPKNWKASAYNGGFDDTGMNTTIPQDILNKLGLKSGDSVMFEFKGRRISTNVGPNGRVGLTRPEINKLGYLNDQKGK